MKAKLIKKMLKSGDYDHMTVSEFKKEVDHQETFNTDEVFNDMFHSEESRFDGINLSNHEAGDH